jgi:hypothetical protein
MAFKNDVADDMAPIRHRLAPVWPPSGPPSGPVGPPVRHPVWYPVGPLVWPPSGTTSGTPRPAAVGSEKNYYYFLFIFGCCCRLEKRGKNISVFGFQSPRSPSSPSSPAPQALWAKPREEEGFFGLVPLVTHPSSIPLLGGLTPKFLSLSFHSL